MSVALALLSAFTAGLLPVLPARGLARETVAGVQLQTMSGRPLMTIFGVDLAQDQKRGSLLVLRGRGGRLYVLDRARRRLQHLGRAAMRGGCRTTDIRLYVCGRTIRDASGVIARPPGMVGHWVWAERAPWGGAVLAQWSAECEVPVAYLVTGRRVRSYGANTVAVGWLPSREALVHFAHGGCGRVEPRRGLYAVALSGKRRLVLPTPPFAGYAMWGG